MVDLKVINFDLISPAEVKRIMQAELRRRENYPADRYIWKTAQGRYIRLDEMSRRHVENCIKMAQRLEVQREIGGDFDPVFDCGER